MAGMSDYAEQSELNAWFRTAAFPKPSNVYFSLHTADPTDAGTGAEVAGGAYARVALAVADASWTAPSVSGASYQITNALAITFAAPTADWGVVTHIGIWTAVTAGSLIASGALAASRTVLSGDNAPTLPIGAVVLKKD